jgi:disulfide bond formation protein DsbB
MSLAHVLDRWRLAALIAAAAMLAVAHAFQTFGGMAPCELCLKQRDLYWVAGGLALGGMVVVRAPGGARLRQLTCWILAIAFACEAVLAAYHAGVEWHFWRGPQSCTTAGATHVSVADLKALLNSATAHVPMCDKPAWVFLGVSMAGWNAVAALILTLLSLAAAMRERSRR